ncbi:MAG: PLP-dependent aminotransferase family protein [Candidatus Ancillula sp.]|jgi:DNA-binding transcriptional MocR family regulator|nr:PLP-dependent aminotransferase family protein [Candidatus Ancillula sp.]
MVYYSFSSAALSMRPSEIRSLFSVVNRPEVISLAGGMPNLKHMPFNEIASTVGSDIREHGEKMWQYSNAQGDKRLREQILEITALEEVESDVDNIIACTGSQQALDFVTRVFINPGDVILSEAPNYVGALGAFLAYNAEIRNSPMDDQGLIPSELEKTINQVHSEGKTIKFLYTIPNFHNPAGVTMSLERRPQILEICKQNNILILEDNPYGLLGFESQTLPAIYSFDYDASLGYAPSVIYLGSFSKIIAPGLRVGWIIAPDLIRDRLVLSAESALLCPSQFAQMTVSSYLEHFDWKAQINEYRSMYKSNFQVMKRALNDFLPDLHYNEPHGGFYVWLELPNGVDAKKLLPIAVEKGVAFVPGTGFFSNGEGSNYVRLSFCYPNEDEIYEGIRRLADALVAYK